MKWPEVRQALDVARATVLVTSSETADLHAGALAGTSVRRVFAVGPGPSLRVHRTFGPCGADDGVQPLRLPRWDRAALVLHTSGSNGRPKAVVLSRESVDHVVRDRIARARLDRRSVLAVASCLAQTVGLYQGLAALAAGATVVLLGSYDVDPMVETIHRHRPTHLIMVVDAFDRLLHDPRITADSLAGLTFACAGADRVTARVQDRFLALTGRALAVSYGLTESTWALFNPGDRLDKRLALGRAGPDVAVTVRRPTGDEASVGEVGEIHVRSPGTMLGYLGDEEGTREALVDGWLATGDLAHRDAEGWFWFCGRRKNLIVLSSGDNVSPVEVEDAILAHPAVSHCSVVGACAPDGSEVPWAFVTRRDDALSTEDLERFLRERISDFKVPRRIEFVVDRPVGPTGKVDFRGRLEIEAALARGG
jgi:long-chain acyl-CoA synthetase